MRSHLLQILILLIAAAGCGNERQIERTKLTEEPLEGGFKLQDKQIEAVLTDDTFISRYNPGMTFGHLPFLRVNGPYETSLLKFQMPKIKERSVKKAELKLFVGNDPSVHAQYIHRITPYWREDTVNWKNFRRALPPSEKGGVKFSATQVGHVVTIDVTDLIANEELIAFSISMFKSGDRASFGSQKYGDRGPKLVLTLSNLNDEFVHLLNPNGCRSDNDWGTKACWYHADVAQSCQSTCEDRGGMHFMNDLIANESAEACQIVYMGLNNGAYQSITPYSYVYSPDTQGLGCFTTNYFPNSVSQAPRFEGDAKGVDAYGIQTKRICGCNE